jgi:hypothetical protein
MLRLLARLAAALTLALGPVLAHAQPQQQQPQLVPAPDRHPATGLTFPPQIANAVKSRSMDYGKSMNRPNLGYGWSYQEGQSMVVTVYVYNLGIQAIPDGPSSAPVGDQLQSALGEIRQAAPSKHYDQLKIAKGPADCTIGRLAFRCVTLSAMQNGRPIFTAVMVTGYRNHFLKLRLDWQESEISQATVDSFMQTLVGTIVR